MYLVHFHIMIQKDIRKVLINFGKMSINILQIRVSSREVKIRLIRSRVYKLILYLLLKMLGVYMILRRNKNCLSHLLSLKKPRKKLLKEIMSTLNLPREVGQTYSRDKLWALHVKSLQLLWAHFSMCNPTSTIRSTSQYHLTQTTTPILNILNHLR